MVVHFGQPSTKETTLTNILFKDGLWQAHNAYAHRAALKAAGWRWDAPYKRWSTADLRAVCAVSEAFPGLLGADALALLNEQQSRSDARLAASNATSAPAAAVDHAVPPGLELMPFQRAGIANLSGMPRALLADEMGLGKTVQAIVTANMLWGTLENVPQAPLFLVIAPAGLLLNWQKEIERWSLVPAEYWCLVSWSKLAKETDVLAHSWYLTIVDEAHYAKDRGTQRTKALQQIVTRRAIALTGTPILNRPVEIFPLLQWLAPARWGTFWSFAQRYCGAHRGRYGWDFSGATNIEELDERLRRSVMVRRLKAQVLTELPAKRRQVIPLELSTKEEERLIKEEQTAFDAWQAAKGEGKKEKLMLSLAQLATARQKIALVKVPLVVTHVRDILDADEGPVVLFAHHHAVIDELAESFGGYRLATYDGRTTLRQRQATLEAFQSGHIDVLVAGIQAAGVGITLTRASVAVFAELDWVPANMAQAEDRLHRIGQTSAVLVQYLVYNGSVDDRVAEALARKQKTLDEFDGWAYPSGNVAK